MKMGLHDIWPSILGGIYLGAAITLIYLGIAHFGEVPMWLSLFNILSGGWTLVFSLGYLRELENEDP